MRRGQTVVEYMITLSVVSIAIIAIMYGFQSATIDNVRALSFDMADEDEGSLINAGIQQQ
jgi:hypothetical protein